VAQSGTLGSSSSSSTLGKHPRHPKSSDTANKHIKVTDNEDIPACQGCSRFGHGRDACDLSDHPDFNRSGDWVGSAAEIAIRAFGRRTQPNTPIPTRVKLFKHLQADGTKFRRPLSYVPPPLLWMPTPAAIMTIEIILADEAAREDAVETHDRGKVALTKAFTQENVRSIWRTLLPTCHVTAASLILTGRTDIVLSQCDHPPLTSPY
jgi:hypothetical protein